MFTIRLHTKLHMPSPSTSLVITIKSQAIISRASYRFHTTIIVLLRILEKITLMKAADLSPQII
jgi:hypothetical protein